LATQTAPRARAPGYLPKRSLKVDAFLWVDAFFDAGGVAYLSNMFISLPVRFLKLRNRR
jgi:hypothetical protein